MIVLIARLLFHPAPPHNRIKPAYPPRNMILPASPSQAMGRCILLLPGSTHRAVITHRLYRRLEAHTTHRLHRLGEQHRHHLFHPTPPIVSIFFLFYIFMQLTAKTLVCTLKSLMTYVFTS